jgi:hypothetical protein
VADVGVPAGITVVPSVDTKAQSNVIDADPGNGAVHTKTVEDEVADGSTVNVKEEPSSAKIASASQPNVVTDKLSQLNGPVNPSTTKIGLAAIIQVAFGGIGNEAPVKSHANVPVGPVNERPAAPVGPATPAGPTAPVGPVNPKPAAPAGPVGPTTAVNVPVKATPAGPVGPVGPTRQIIGLNGTQQLSTGGQQVLTGGQQTCSTQQVSTGRVSTIHGRASTHGRLTRPQFDSLL